MPTLFSNCFGKKRSNAAESQSACITEVQVLSHGKGNCLIEPIELELTEAGASKSIQKLERAIHEANRSGLLAQSHVFFTEKQRLQTWKNAVSELISTLNSNDTEKLSSALDEVKKLQLVDEDGDVNYGQQLLNALRAKSNLQQAVLSENVDALDGAVSCFHKTLSKLDTAKTGRRKDVDVFVEDELTSAEKLLRKLKAENRFYNKNPDFPKQELEKAIDARNLDELRPALKRWKRLGLDEQSFLYISGVRVLEQLVELNRSVAIQNLEKCLNQRDARGIKDNLSAARDVGIPQAVIEIYSDTVLAALENQHRCTSDVIRALRQNDYTTVGDHLSSCDVLTASLDDKVCDQRHSIALRDSSEFVSLLGHVTPVIDEYCYNDVIENAKSQTLAILNEATSVLLVAQCAARASRLASDAFLAMDDNVKSIESTINSLAREHGVAVIAGNDLRDSFSSRIRQSFRQSPNDRLLMLRNLINVVADKPDNLCACVEEVRSSIRALESAQRLTVEPVRAWETRNSPNLPKSTNSEDKLYEVCIADFTVVHHAEALLDIVRRFVCIAQAEIALTLFQTSPSTPRDKTEVEEAITNLDKGLTDLCSSEYFKVTDPGFLDLCYNRSQCENHSHVRLDNSDTMKVVLDSISRLFPEKSILATKKAAEIRMVELQLMCVDEEAKVNSARYALKQAISTRCEGDLIRALQVSSVGLARSDSAVSEAESELRKLRNDKRLCRDSLRIAIGRKNDVELEGALARAEELYIAPTDGVIVSARQELCNLRFVKSRQDAAREELEKVVETKIIREVRAAISRAKACQMSTSDPVFSKAKHILARHHSGTAAAEASIKRVVDNLRRNIELDEIKSSVIKADHLNCAESISAMATVLLSSRKNGDHTNRELGIQLLCKYLQHEVENVKEGRVSKSSFENLRNALEHVETEALDVPADIIAAAVAAVSLVNERRGKVASLKTRLGLAIAANSISDLTIAIANAEAAQELMDFNVDGKVEDNYDLLARAKERFAMLKVQRKSEDEDKMNRHRAAARRQLKKAMLGDANAAPLREAVRTFRAICTPRSDDTSNANESPEISCSKQKPVYMNEIRKDKSKNVNSRVKSLSDKRSRRPRARAQKLSKTNIPKTSNHFSKQPRAKSCLIIQSSSRGNSNLSKEEEKLCEMVNEEVDEDTSLTQAILTSDYTQLRNEADKSEIATGNGDIPRKAVKSSASLKRPKSAIETLPLELEREHSPKQAWEVLEDKNISLLRKAEKSLKRIEREEEEIKHKELLQNIRNKMVSNLKMSTESGDRAELWQAIHEFTRYFGEDGYEEDKEALTKAKQALFSSTGLQYQENLTTAILERNLNKLEHVLYQIENDSNDFMPRDEEERNAFMNNISRGQHLVVHLTELSKYRNAVMTMSRSLVSEINSYPSPPYVVRSVMASTYLLLGESEATVKEWPSLKALMGQLGRSALTRRVETCSPASVSLAVSRKALTYISDLTFDRVHAISIGTSTFYAWATCMINEVLNQNGEELPNMPIEIEQNFCERQITPSTVTSRKLSAELWQHLALRNSNKTRKKIYGVTKQTLIMRKKSRASSAHATYKT